MATAMMMYVLPMLLGQTYHLGKDKPGLLIYPKDVADHALKIERYFTDSQYRMVENVQEMKDFLDVGGKLSLKIKGGIVDISGEGSYLKDSSSKTNGIEILVKLHFETVTLSIPTSKKPNADWFLFPKEFLGTHYCRSITYGGDLVASIRISGSSKYDLERIKGAISGGVKTKGGGFTGDIKGKLDLLKQNAQDSSSMEINYYASVPIHGVSYTIDGLIKLVENFPQHVAKVNNGLGNPLRMEMYPLSSLKDGYPAYFENKAISDELDDLENQFDDLRDTRRQLGIWITQLPPIVSDSVQKKIDDFVDKLNDIFSIYMKTIANLDVSQGASTKPIKDAFEAYRDGEYILPQKFNRKFQSFKREIYKEAPELQPQIGGAYFIHWGRSECKSSVNELTLSGIATASELLQDGSSAEFLCSPLNPDQVQPKDYFTNYKPEEDDPKDHLLLRPIRYAGRMERFKSMLQKNIACARCRTGRRTALLVKMADKTCPKNWVKEYEGYMMAPGIYGGKGEYICVDKDMKEPDGSITFGNEKEPLNLLQLQEVTVTCGSLPCGPYEDSKPIPCVVCTI